MARVVVVAESVVANLADKQVEMLSSKLILE